MRTMIRGMMVCGAVLLLLAGSARAANQVWIAGSGDYTNVNNWSGTAKPVAGDSATFTNPTYTVNFTGAEASGYVQLTNAANVTFNLGGNTYAVNNGGTELYIGSNATDNVKLTVTGGTLNLGSSGTSYLANNGTATLQIDDSAGSPGRVDFLNFSMGNNATVIVSGPGSRLYNGAGAANGSFWNGTFLTTNGGLIYVSNQSGVSPNITVTGVGSTNTLWGSVEMLGSGGSIKILDGGVVNTFSPWSIRFAVSGGTPVITVGSGVHTSVLESTTIAMAYQGVRGSPEMIVNKGGIVRGTTAAYNTLWLDDNSTVTMNGGEVQVAAGGAMYLQDWNVGGSQPLLRGSGTLSRYGAGSNFTINNEGRIRVGDTNATPAMGKLALNYGNLIQTNTARPNAGINFEFGATSYDQINIANGFAQITAGSNVFALASGAPAPVHGVKYGLGVYDFIIATNISYGPQYDNLTYLLTNTYHLTYNVDFTYGVVPLVGGLFALELQFVPEPSVALLLALGGLMVYRRMAKRQKTRGPSVRAALVGLAVLLVLAAGSAPAQVVTEWTNTSGGTFSADSNWSVAHPLTGTNAVFGLSGQTYAVGFTGAAQSGALLITGQNQIVTFNLSNNTYQAATSGGSSVISRFWLGSNATDNVRLIVNTGTFNLQNANNPAQQIGLNGGTASLVISNGAYFTYNYLTIGANGNLTVVGPNTTMQYGSGSLADNGTFTVMTGGTATIANVSGTGNFIVDGGKVISATGDSIAGSGGTLTIKNGGMWQSTGTTIGISGGSPIVTIGNGSGTSTLQTADLGLGYWAPIYGRGAVSMTITNGGLVKITGKGFALGSDLEINEVSTLTLNSGMIQMTNGSRMVVGAQPATANRGVLRGSGTISRFGASSENFQLLNRGIIRPGDTSATPGIGTLAINGGNLTQTSTPSQARMYFEFGTTGYDQINIANGLALITTGTNTFALAAGAPAPVPGAKYGLGVYDFIIATNITYTPQYDNLVNLLTNTYHLTYNVDFTYGVVPLNGGLFALELMFVPEPSTVLLLALGGLMVWRRMVQKCRK